MDKDQIHDEYGKKPASDQYMGTIIIDNPEFYRLFDSNPYHTNINAEAKFLAEVNKLSYGYLLRK